MEFAFTDGKAAAVLEAAEQAVIVDKFVNEEKEWLMQQKASVFASFDRHVEKLCESIRAYGNVRKRKFEEMLQSMVESIESYRSAEKLKWAVESKKANRHLQQVFCTYAPVNIGDIIRFNESPPLIKRMNIDAQTARASFDGTTDSYCFTVSASITITGLLFPNNSERLPVKVSNLLIRPLCEKWTLRLGEFSEYVQKQDIEVDSTHIGMVAVRLESQVKLEPWRVYKFQVELQNITLPVQANILEGFEKLNETWNIAENQPGQSGRGVFLGVTIST